MNKVFNSLRYLWVGLAVGLVISVVITVCSAVAARGNPTTTILFIGDSIISVAAVEDELCGLMDEVNQQCDVVNAAVGGTQCGYFTPLISDLLTTHQPDIVVLACGTNHDTTTGEGQYWLGWHWRTIVETIYTHQESPRIKILPAFIQYSDPTLTTRVPNWVIESQPITNDTIYNNFLLYWNAGWFTGIADFQKIPNGSEYIDDWGIHPTQRGAEMMARILYDQMYVSMGWQASPRPAPCGMSGHRIGYLRPTYTDC